MTTIQRAGRTATVLLIDDSSAVRAGVRALLSGDPALRVVGDAWSGSEGLERARDLRPDLIVLDQEMPGLTGIEILRRLGRMLPGTRVVFFTLSVEIERQALALGAVAVVAKEEPARLLATLQRLAADAGPAALGARNARRQGQPRVGR